MRVMLALILAVGALAPSVPGQEPAQNPQVNAATADAIESLKREIVAAHVTPDLSVADLLNKVGGVEELDKTIRSAEQLGGPRWLSDQFVQVRLTIDGNQIARTVEKLVEAQPKRSPISPEALRRDMASWADRTFSATGTSAGAADVTRLRPAPSNLPWQSVSDADRRKALLAARDHAVTRVIEGVSGIPVSGNQTLGSALSEPEVAKTIKAWLEKRPVKAVEFGDDRVVRLTFADPGDELWSVLRPALEHQKHVPLPQTQAEWDQLKDQVLAHSTGEVGSAAVESQGPVARPAPAVALPAVAPPWSNQLLQAEATAQGSGSRLFTARKAETAAQDKLRTQLEALPLNGGLTVGLAAQKEPRIRKAITRALAHARPSQVDYGAKGVVTVHMELHLSDFWADLSGEQ